MTIWVDTTTDLNLPYNSKALKSLKHRAHSKQGLMLTQLQWSGQPSILWYNWFRFVILPLPNMFSCSTYYSFHLTRRQCFPRHTAEHTSRLKLKASFSAQPKHKSVTCHLQNCTLTEPHLREDCLCFQKHIFRMSLKNNSQSQRLLLMEPPKWRLPKLPASRNLTKNLALS